MIKREDMVKLLTPIVDFVEEHSKCGKHVCITYPSWPYTRLILTCHPCGDELEIMREEDNNNASAIAGEETDQ